MSTNDAPFVARFRETAAREASRVAIEDGRTWVTYAELEARADAIAAELCAQGAREGDVVAVRSGDRIAIAIGMLAAWMANAAFVVIPPELPEERAQLMARDAHVAFTVDRAILDAQPGRVAEHFGAPSLAYVVFTSGTTGRPKGVLVTHDGIVPMLDAQIAAFELRAGARCLWVSSPLFDASISDVGTALLSGATLVCENARLSPRALVARMDALGITHVDLPPSLLALLDVASLPKSLHTIVIGGEPCADAVVERTSARVRVVNVYGPTEATVCTSLCVCHPEDRHHGRLGLPLPHVKYLVEDGELLIGGTCLARGYADDDALTRRRFVERTGERFYRTGDRVRLREDGVELELVGRVDRQVKIAGVRIEPEEIESRLRDDHDVLDVAVIPVARSLCAFVVLRDAASDVLALHARLAKGVPSWLVPARFVVLEALPRLSSGKVDHVALLALATSEPDLAKPVSDESLRALCQAMGAALGRAVAPDDDFIAEGADSLAILEACAEADARGLIVSPETIATQRTATRIAASREIAGASIATLEADVATVLEGRAVDSRRSFSGAWEAKPPISMDTTAVGGRAVFVTGATGTLGARLVREILATGAVVTCLVRAHGDGAALERLRVTLPGVANVRAVAGDVAMPCFGMPPARFAALATEHDAIVHAAADLSLAAAYAQLRDTNVLGTAHALDFAHEGRPKAVHYISTLSVLASTDRARRACVFSEVCDLHDATTVYGAYAQTKWVAEALVRRAAPGAFVHRLGLLLPARGRDLFAAFVQGVAALGCAPVCPGLAFDVTPADFAAKALAHFVALGGATRTRHIANRLTASLDNLVSAMCAEGVRVDRVSVDAFERRLAERLKISGLSLATLRASARGSSARVVVNPFDLFEATNVRFGAEPTLEELARCGIVCKAPAEVLAGYVRNALARGAG